MFFIFPFRANTINRKRSINEPRCKLCDVLSGLLVTAYKHEFKEILAMITQVVLFYEVNHQV